MVVSRHIILRDTPTACWREDFRFRPPLEIDLSLGNISTILNSQTASQNRKVSPLRKCKPIINTNGILHINEVMKAGETMSIILRVGYRLADIVLREVHQLLILANDQGLHYWFTVGQDGVVEITGTMVKDSDGFHAKLKSNLKDIPYRAYIVQRSLAGTKPTDTGLPSIMNTEQAAAYLGLSRSKTYKLAQSGEIRRTPQKRFRKADLDAYLETSQKPKKRR